MKLLLVEDEHELAEMYTLQLQRLGHQVVWADSAQMALDKLDDAKADAIVLDMLMPNNNGLSVLYELRSYHDWRKIPVVILSNVRFEELGVPPETLQKLGVHNYLIKSKTKAADLAAALESLHV